MYIKKGFLRKMIVALIFSMCMLIMWFIFATTTIKIKTSTDRIESFVYNSLEIQPKDYKKVLSRIESMRFYYTEGNPQSREMDLYIFIRDFDGNEEIIGCNDDLVTHMYVNEVVEKYKIPLVTQMYIATQ